MTVDELRDFIRQHHQGVLATRRRDGQPQLSPVTVGVDEDGTLIISTRETALKTANVRREPYASVCIFTDCFFGPWVQAVMSGDDRIAPRGDGRSGALLPAGVRGAPRLGGLPRGDGPRPARLAARAALARRGTAAPGLSAARKG